MRLKIDKRMVEVLNNRCKDVDCFNMFADKGTFVQGRGYTSYHNKVRWVCGTRHLQGCPNAGQCECGTIYAPAALKCGHCNKEIRRE